MDATLALAESLMSTVSKSTRKPDKQDHPVDAVASFFAEPLPVSPPKPPLPPELEQFCYLHRMAATGAIPADKAAQVIEAIHHVADMLPNKNKRKLMIESRMEELEELNEWLLQWTPPQFEVGEDPFAGE